MPIPHAASGAGRASPGRRARTRQAERTRATRRKLLDAAKRIFAQDGFEARPPGRYRRRRRLHARGAFYANFKSKEDIFFALFEEWVRERIESLTAALRRQSDPAEKLVALRTHYAELATDRRLVLISMEFKLFALRHPGGARPAAQPAPPHSGVVRPSCFRK